MSTFMSFIFAETQVRIHQGDAIDVPESQAAALSSLSQEERTLTPGAKMSRQAP